MANRHNQPTWPPGREAYAEILRSQNPWHDTPEGQVPASLAREVERPLAQALYWRVLKDSPRRFHVILGPRRVGKTTVMYQTARHLLREGVDRRRVFWIRVDHPMLMEVPLGDLVAHAMEQSGAGEERPLYLFLDELVYARDWGRWLKTFYDEQWPVRIVASSSAAAALRDQRDESGVGRWEEHPLAPYTFTEYLDLRAIDAPATPAETLRQTLAGVDPNEWPVLSSHRERFLLTGGFPELLTLRRRSEEEDDESIMLESQRTLRTDAVERAIYRDIPQTYGVDKPMTLERLLYMLAGQCAGVLSPSSVCNALGDLTQPTFERYLAYLERAYLVFTLQNYAGSESKRQRRGRKVYFYDSAVRNAALQRGAAPLSDPVEMGHLLENLAAAQLHALAMQTQTRLHHWRDDAGEVDLIYDHPTAPLAFEVASSPTHSRAGLQALMRRFDRFRGGCYLIAPSATLLRPEKARDGIGSMPMDVFLVCVGRQADLAMRRRVGVA